MSQPGAYQQELKRSLGGFQVFAISFAFISVAVGVFGTYDDLLRHGGPVAVWLWPIVAVGQTLIALVVAQLAARIPLSGSSYQWASRLANPRIGWGFGWLTFLYLATASVTVANVMASQAFMPLLGIAPDEGTARLLTLAILLAAALVSIGSTRLVGLLNTSAVVVEFSLILVIGVALVVAVLVSGDGSADNLTSRGVTADADDYLAIGGGLMLATLMGLGTLTGFDAAANLAEEAKDPYRSVPRAIVGSVVAAAVLGLLFTIVLTVAIPDIPAVSESGPAVATILREQLGRAGEKALLVAITFSFFAAAVVIMTSCSRMIFAMSRDGRFPAHTVMRRVNPVTQTPIPATLLVLALGIVLMVALPGNALDELLSASTILPAVTYGAIVVLYLAVRGRLDRRAGAFDLGRADLPVAVAALVWSAVAICFLTFPANAAALVIDAGLLALGGVYFLLMLRFNRGVLDREC